MISPRHKPSPLTRSGAARAFTLLELMLAVVLGALVLSTALGVFVALQRSERHSRDHLRSTIELSVAHRACDLALRSMILSDTRPPQPPPDLGNARNDTPTPPVEIEPVEFERPRVLLSRQDSDRPMRWLDAQGLSVELDPQRLEITIERPPVFAEPEPGENFAPVVHRMYASRRERDREQRREERDAERATGDSEEADNPFDSTEPAIAAGVRGAFELSWEPQRLTPGEPINPDGGSWTLWWRTLPPIVTIPGSETTEGLSLDELRRNPMYRPVKLASNLRWCKWEAVRAGETLSEFQSTWWEDLPAFVTLEIQTLTGKWSKWMFEVQGTRGPEPGTVSGEQAPTEIAETDPVTGEPVERAIDGNSNERPPPRQRPGQRLNSGSGRSGGNR